MTDREVSRASLSVLDDLKASIRLLTCACVISEKCAYVEVGKSKSLPIACVMKV